LNSIEQSYQIHRLSKERLHDLYRLFKNSKRWFFQKSYKFFKEKYNTSYTGIEYVGFIAYDLNGDPAAFYGIIPMIGNYNGESILIGQSADTLTHPNHQKKGLFIYLANRTYILAKEEGVKFLYGLPNSNSYPGFIKKLAWNHQDDIFIYSIRIKQFPIAKVFKLSHITNVLFEYYVQVLTLLFWKNKMFFFNEIVKKVHFGYIQVFYDKKYLEYKKNGGNFYVLKFSESSEMFIKVNGKLKIGFINDSLDFDFKLFKKLKLFAFFCGCNEIEYKSNFSNELSDKFFNRRKGSEVITKSLVNDLDDFKLKINYFDFDTF
jgi:hypothetical protein